MWPNFYIFQFEKPFFLCINYLRSVHLYIRGVCTFQQLIFLRAKPWQLWHGLRWGNFIILRFWYHIHQKVIQCSRFIDYCFSQEQSHLGNFETIWGWGKFVSCEKLSSRDNKRCSLNGKNILVLPIILRTIKTVVWWEFGMSYYADYAFVITHTPFSDWLLFLRRLRRRACTDTSGDMMRAIHRELNDARRLVSSMTDGS